LGSNKENQSKLFKLFGTISDDKNIFNKQGCGLGLTVCKKIVEELNGDIKIVSRYQEGTKITFWIKFQIPNNDDLNEESKEE
jgi:signal transduction histidine kinase